MLNFLYAITVHNADNLELLGSTEAQGDPMNAKAALTRLMREIESKAREESKYEGLSEEEI